MTLEERIQHTKDVLKSEHEKIMRRKVQVARNEIDRAMRFKFGHVFCKLQDVSAVCLYKEKGDEYDSPINYSFIIFTANQNLPAEVFDQLTALIDTFLASKSIAGRDCKVHINYATNNASDVLVTYENLLETYIHQDTYEADFIPNEVFKNSVSIKPDEHDETVYVVRYHTPYTV